MGNKLILYRFCRLLLQYIAVLLFKVRYFGTRNVPRTGPVLLVSNHQSFMDPPLVGISLKRICSFMARDSLFTNRWFGWLIASVNAFPVSRDTADIGAIKESFRRLKKAQALVLFPEGTRTSDGKIQPLFPGFCGIAKKTQVPIIPTLIDGVFQAWPRKNILPRPGSVIVEYGQPIMPEEYKNLTADELADQIRNILIEMQQRWHNRLPKHRLKWYDPDKNR